MVFLGRTTVIGLTILFTGLWLLAQPVHGKSKKNTEAFIVEPFLEIHTGPNRGAPVFYIAEKGETIDLLKRRTDWYKVRLTNGKQGWVHRLDIEKTLRASGYQKGILERFYDRYLENRLEVGFGSGAFGGDATLIFRATYHFNDYLAIETSSGFASGDIGGTDVYQAGLVMMPWKTRWISFFATAGGGLVRVEPTSLLVNTEKDASPSAHAGIGFTVPLFRDLWVRGDFRNVTVFKETDLTQEFQEYSMGVSFRF